MTEPTNLQQAMKAAERPAPPQLITRTAVMTRMADAMHRLDRLAEAMERAADEAERQLSIVKARL